jgi:hypothetical protein
MGLTTRPSSASAASCRWGSCSFSWASPARSFSTGSPSARWATPSSSPAAARASSPTGQTPPPLHPPSSSEELSRAHARLPPFLAFVGWSLEDAQCLAVVSRSWCDDRQIELRKRWSCSAPLGLGTGCWSCRCTARLVPQLVERFCSWVMISVL